MPEMAGVEMRQFCAPQAREQRQHLRACAGAEAGSREALAPAIERGRQARARGRAWHLADEDARDAVGGAHAQDGVDSCLVVVAAIAGDDERRSCRRPPFVSDRARPNGSGQLTRCATVLPLSSFCGSESKIDCTKFSR
jgi:hypothetical protein